MCGHPQKKKVRNLHRYPKVQPEKDKMPNILYIQNYIRKAMRLSIL